MRLFIYGTLRHLPLLNAILGAGHTARIRTGFLPAHEVIWSPDGPWPHIRENPTGIAAGLVLDQLSADDVARLDYYEAAFGYTTRRFGVRVENEDGTPEGEMSAAVYFSDVAHSAKADLWSLDNWVRDYGDVAVETAFEAISYFPDVQASEMGRRFSQMKSRAASRLRARADTVTPMGDLGRNDVTVHSMIRPYSNFFVMEEHNLTFGRFDGTPSAEVNRAVLIGGDAAILLPYDPVRDRVMLVEQFRAAPYVRGDAAPWMLEPIAGRVDAGETPVQAAKREAIEEAGLTLTAIEEISRSYPSPGVSTEFFHLFLGLCDLPDDSVGVGGLEGESEDIKSHLLDAETLISMADQGEIRVLPLFTAIQWLARHRDRLRAG
jgi:nudix-type nucleoside diphosphatase (YffH/AdpP family)